MEKNKGGMVNDKFDYFVLNKNNNKILFGFNWSEKRVVDTLESLKSDANLFLEMNIDGFSKKDYSILSANTLKSMGIDPYSWSNWNKETYDRLAKKEKMFFNYAKGGKVMPEWSVTITSDSGDTYDWVGHAKDEDDALNKAEKEAKFESVESGINMITDENGKSIDYAKGGAVNNMWQVVESLSKKQGQKEFTTQEYHTYRDDMYEMSVKSGFFDDNDENYSAFDDMLGKKLNVNWDMAKGGGVKEIDYADVYPILKDKIDNVIDDIPFENAFDGNGEEVEHRSRDGFWAYTDGGYEYRWFEYVSYMNGSGKSLPTKPLDAELDRQVQYNYDLAKETFIDNYPEIVEELGEDKINYNDLYEAGYGSEAEELSEMEMDYGGEDSIMMRVFAYYYSPENSRAENGKHTISLFGDVNLESPYHRAGNLDDSMEITFTFTSLADLSKKMDTNLKKIVGWFKGDYYNKSKKEMKIRRMGDGGHTQGYDDREDERLSMEHGKMSGKDFVGTHSQKEHSRRDDARFEERMAKGGEPKGNDYDLMKGGISHYSVDIDLQNGDNVRDLEYKSLDKAKKVYGQYSKSMVYNGEAIEDIQLIKVLKNGDYESIGGAMADGGMMAWGGFVTNLKDAYASDDMLEELKSKMKDGEPIVAFAYTDYGGDFFDKVAIEYFIENYPNNIVYEHSAYNGKNGVVFGEPAREFLEVSDRYLLGFDDMEDFYYQMENEETEDSFEFFLRDLSNYGGYIVSERAMDWLMENKSGYYSMLTTGLDFSSSDLEEELLEEGLITKERMNGGMMAKGGKTKELELLVDSHHGIYVPKVFVDNYDLKQFGFNDKDIAYFKKAFSDTQSDDYFDAYEEMESKAITKDGSTITTADGNLWLVPKGYEYDDYFYGEDGGMMAKGGSVRKNPKSLWNNWTPKQRYHFLQDHFVEIEDSIDEDDLQTISRMDYEELIDLSGNGFIDINDSLSKHIRQGVYAKGGKVGDYDNIRKTNTITEREVALIMRRLNSGKDDKETKEIVNYIWDNKPSLTSEQNKKGLDFLYDLYKSPSGKERKNNPFGYREQDVLENFVGFELSGYYNASRYGQRPYYIPLYIANGKDGSFEYYYSNGEVNIVGGHGGMFKRGGKVKYVPNRDIKSLTTKSGKVISQKDILDGAYVNKSVKLADGGMMADGGMISVNGFTIELSKFIKENKTKSETARLEEEDIERIKKLKKGESERFIINSRMIEVIKMADGGMMANDVHWWEVKLKMPNGKIVYTDVVADNKEDAKYYGKMSDYGNEGGKVLSVKSKGMEKYADGGSVGGFDYKKVDTSTEAGDKRADKLQSQGWEVISGSLTTMVTMRRAKKQKKQPQPKMEQGGEMVDVSLYAKGGVERIANNESKTYTENLIPFKANNIEAKTLDNGDYVVLSYGYYPIWWHCKKENKWYGNKDKYSQTTAKQMSQSRPTYDAEMLGRNELEKKMMNHNAMFEVGGVLSDVLAPTSNAITQNVGGTAFSNLDLTSHLGIDSI